MTPSRLYGLAALLLVACGPNLAFMAERSRSEALALQELCRKGELQSGEITLADSLLSESNRFWKQGKAEEARLASDEAGGLYRVTLARAARDKAESTLAAVESDLAKDKERLATYREILEEMKTMRKP